MPCGWYFISDGFAVTLHPDTFSYFTNCELKGKSMVVTNETEQGRQYKEYTHEATGNKAERSAQLLGGEFLDEPSGKAERWYE
jgi:hypothetical protein